ncbi:50S ribosomal protein L17 [Rhodohalobacter sp. SW132]|uniref:50S ribosomal protein L17 n=1 Tax=Rhodohalobacter sp. SW132 TaxID=2293433 RepID=UPI000E28098F|nr:50S ribosomal protein L17 [Rhodohalobacter sp. SW132]
MRHLVKGKKLGRSTPHRVATLKALSCSLIKHKQIQTTVAKAKELRRYIEPVITRSKEDNSHNRREAFSALQDKDAVTILFDEVGPAVGDRPGGYTRVLKLGFRLGDSAEMALIELVDFSDYEPEKKSAKKKRTRRAGKANKPTSSDDKGTDSKPEEKSAPAAEKEKTGETASSDEPKETEKKATEEVSEKKEETKNTADDADSADSESEEEKK